MADTHINAFFADVDEAQKGFEQAAAALQDARARLEVKKKEVGYVEPKTTKEVETTVPEPQDPTVTTTVTNKKK